jgi:hypothetical protein
MRDPEDITEEDTYYAGHLGIPEGFDDWGEPVIPPAADDEDAPYDPALGGGFI